jgi:hypothetical protein
MERRKMASGDQIRQAIEAIPWGSEDDFSSKSDEQDNNHCPRDSILAEETSDEEFSKRNRDRTGFVIPESSDDEEEEAAVDLGILDDAPPTKSTRSKKGSDRQLESWNYLLYAQCSQ